MTKEQTNAVRDFKREVLPRIEELQQNLLISEPAMISMGRERGLCAPNTPAGKPRELVRVGWLEGDGLSHDGGLLFHPFKLYALHRILQSMPLQRSAMSDAWIADGSQGWNTVVDLARLLEPIYWPRIMGSLSFKSTEEQHRKTLADYKAAALRFVKDLDPTEWVKAHASLRTDAGWLDKNGELYLLLRLSPWNRRSKLTGTVAGALWFRHLAEVIRCGFEEAQGVRWLEEDQSFGRWGPGARTRAFGSDRPLDDEFASKPYLAYRFGLFTGSAVRWYMEGDTEYYAVDQILPEPQKVAIECVNLKGAIVAGKGNAALKLSDMLAQDRAFRRFSIISFDLDVDPNKKAISQLIKSGLVVGSIAASRPDFELANFTLDELVEIAARIDEAHGFSGITLRSGDWAGVNTGGKFEARYILLSARKAGGLKGEEWGRALATYAIENLHRPDGTERPLWNEISAAVYCWSSKYDDYVTRFKLDPVTFKQVSLDSTS